MSKLNVSIFMPCYNESAIIMYSINHYKKAFPTCSITIYDNNSTDNSVEIAKSLGCNVILWDTGNKIDDHKLLQLKNECWKTVKQGWIIMCDMDELLCINEEDLLKEQNEKISIIRTKGYNMVGQSNSKTLDDLDFDSIKKGIFTKHFNKSICFNRKYINSMNYEIGSHTCSPTGTISYSKKEYILKHMSYLGLPFLIDRMKLKYQRSSDMRKEGIATHYISDVEEIKSRYNDNFKKSIELNVDMFNKFQMIKTQKELKFIHITKTAGTSIEDEGMKHGKRWGRNHNEYGWWHEIFSKKSKELRNKYDWFMVVRNPYTRIVSEYHYINKDVQRRTKKDFNDFIKKSLHILTTNKTNNDLPWQRPSGDHFTEQHKYLDNESVIHILKYENIKNEFENLMSAYNNNNIRLELKVYETKKFFTVNDISKENIELLNEIYKKDFETFGYTIIDPSTVIESVDNTLSNKGSEESDCDSISELKPELKPELTENMVIKPIIRKELKFIHITRNGGTSIEQVGLDSNKYWGRYHRGYGIFDEIFTNKSNTLKNNYDWFIVVRNPITRILSEYTFLSQMLKLENSRSPNVFNSFIERWLTNILNSVENNPIYGKTTSGHLIPQYKYIDPNVKIHILKFEDLEREFNILMKEYKYNIKLNKKVSVTKHNFNISDITKENIDLICKVYKEDFEQFNYPYPSQGISSLTTINNKYAIVFLTVKPSVNMIDFCKSLKHPNYDIYICVDSNAYTCPIIENITFIQYVNNECIRNGYYKSSFLIKPNDAIAWDKALYHFSRKNTSYNYIWFIEDDVFVPSETCIESIDLKYKTEDILSNTTTLNTSGELKWHWKEALGHIDLPWMKSMVCAIRLSNKVLSLVEDYVQKHSRLLFVEFMFHTLALHKKLNTRVIPELSGILFNGDWVFEKMNDTTLYHPIKDYNRHVKLRSKFSEITFN